MFYQEIQEAVALIKEAKDVIFMELVYQEFLHNMAMVCLIEKEYDHYI